MKPSPRFVFNPPPLLLVSILLAATACSSISGTKAGSGNDIAANGPTVLNPRTQPGTIELNSELEPITSADVLAEVKDQGSSVNDVRLRFARVPIEVPMTNIGSTTWKATLSERELQLLAVTGRTMTYDANIVAKDDAGQTGVSKNPVQVAVKAPDQADGAR